MDKYERELDDFLAADDGLESKPWHEYVSQLVMDTIERLRTISNVYGKQNIG